MPQREPLSTAGLPLVPRTHHPLEGEEGRSGRPRAITPRRLPIDPSDTLQQKKHFAEALSALRAVVPDVVEVNVTHEKVVVIDDHTVMMGSLNALSQQRSREVMITMRGHHWARKLLSHLHAEEFSKPPRCGACHGHQVDLRRTSSGGWYWHCYNRACPEYGKGRYKAWTREIRFNQP